MSRFQRTTKNLAQRIDLHYFQLSHPARRRRFLLSIAIPTIAVVWLTWHGFRRENRGAFSSPGPLSQAHAVFGERCELCHAPETAGYRKHATDQACLDCHDGPAHNSGQTFTPSCAACHMEHRGPGLLSAVRDATCTQCHGALQTRTGSPHFQNVSVFRYAGHPEFAVKLPGRPDPGTIKFSHEVHLDPLKCDACHVPSNRLEMSAKEEARLGAAGSLPPSDPLSSARGAYMEPIKFADHCVACHADKLEFDKRILDSVPHDTPEVIHAAILKQAPAGGKLVADLEQTLWKGKCTYCHTMELAEGELPKVVSSSIPGRWFLHASFSHAAHNVFSCQSCHAEATKSKAASDVLLPAVANCQQCHRPGDSARSDCYECHSYHDWRTRKAQQVTFDVPCLLEKGNVQSCRSRSDDKAQK